MWRKMWGERGGGWVLTAIRAEPGIVAAILAAAALAWWSTADRMSGMDAGPVPTLARSAGSRACGR